MKPNGFKGISLTIDYQRLWPDDKEGMVDITCDGDYCWFYADIGNSFHGAQTEKEGQQAKVLKFGAAVARLVREHFGAVTPILATRHTATKRRTSNAKREP